MLLLFMIGMMRSIIVENMFVGEVVTTRNAIGSKIGQVC
jgi:hypothetical protein